MCSIYNYCSLEDILFYNKKRGTREMKFFCLEKGKLSRYCKQDNYGIVCFCICHKKEIEKWNPMFFVNNVEEEYLYFSKIVLNLHFVGDVNIRRN